MGLPLHQLPPQPTQGGEGGGPGGPGGEGGGGGGGGHGVRVPRPGPPRGDGRHQPLLPQVPATLV